MEEAVAHIKKSRALPDREIPVKKLFLVKYGTFPRRIEFKPAMKENQKNVVFHIQSVLDRLDHQHGINHQLAIVQQMFHLCSKKYWAGQRLFMLTTIEGVMIHFENCKWVTNYISNSQKSIQPDHIPDRHFFVMETISMYYLAEHEAFIQKLAYDLIRDDTLSLAEPRIAILRLIGKHKDRCDGPGSLYLSNCTHIKQPRISDLALSYGGEDFLRVHHKIVTWLNKKDSNGLVLLHGMPGSGKTYYIRYLLHSLTNESERCLIYVPGDMINDLTNPRLLRLLLNYPNSLLIIEDAEGSLTRSRTSDQSVANLLNLSDGLLSDGLQIQILATFNCPLTSLDSALLRPGRLIAQYCFPSTLTIEKAHCLAESIGVTNWDQIDQPLSLANIYAMRDENIDVEQDEMASFDCHKCLYFNPRGEEE